MKKNSALLIFLLFSLVAFAQPGTKGKIVVAVSNPKKQFLENTTVELLKAKDSSLVKVALTDAQGKAIFDNIEFGTYVLKFSMINYTSQFSQVFTTNSQLTELPAITLEPATATNMKEITVTAKKPFIQKLADRIIVNVENSIVNAGSTAFDVLERSPGIQIDPNDNISMRGKAGVIIMIDGKPSPMSGTELVNFLRGLPSGAIDRIELITNPSAKYDAAGTAGIIDIRMKKDQRYGYNGSITAGYGQGVYPKANAGTTFNFRNELMNVFGNYNYSYRMGLNHLLLDRNFFTDGVFTGQDKKDNYTKIPVNFHQVRLGTDFFLGKKTILGFVVNSNFYSYDPYNNNNSVVIDQNKQPLYTFQTKTTNDNSNANAVINLNFKHTFDSTGREITADIDHGIYNNDGYSSTATKYYDLDGNPKQPDYILDGFQDGKLRFTTAKADYVHPLKNDSKIEAGFKTSFVSSDNDAKFYDMSSGIPVEDVTKTNHFFYDENNNAVYLNYSRNFKKFDLQVGLRSEQTNVKTRQVKDDIRWDSSYLQFFPSAFLTYKMKEDETFGVSVSRRIERPNYSDLNPFLFLIDVTTYATGNPGLLPELTWAYELSYTRKSLNFTLGYSHTVRNQNTVIARFKDVFPAIPSEDNVTVQIPVNLESSDYIGLTIAAPVKISSWWNMINNGNIFYNHFNGELGGTVLNNGKVVFNGSSNNTFTFKKGWSAELNGSYSSGGQYGFMVSEPQWGVGVGVQKTVLKSKGTVRLNATDIFWTNLPKATITYDNYIEYWHAYRETRVINLTLIYRFGNNKVQAARRRTTGSEEERQRAQ